MMFLQSGDGCLSVFLCIVYFGEYDVEFYFVGIIYLCVDNVVIYVEVMCGFREQWCIDGVVGKFYVQYWYVICCGGRFQVCLIVIWNIEVQSGLNKLLSQWCFWMGEDFVYGVLFDQLIIINDCYVVVDMFNYVYFMGD